NGIGRILVPEENAREAAVVQGIDVFPVRDLREASLLVQDLAGESPPRIKPLKLNVDELRKSPNRYQVDFSEVRGQAMA
ncbi:hypothetical protein, partial [Vibrio parahaemolyticus]|uniref:hypothetical protein n=1 Tax=Vibrio parahaemolyticus TaxID=670 RepID=UPI001A909EDD